MAIDTAPKRRAAAAIGFWLFAPGVTPDATPDAFWRAAVGWTYSGLAAPAGGTWTPALQGYAERRTRRVMVYKAAYDITKHDTNDITQFATMGPTEAVYVGGAGVVAAVFADGTVANFTAVAGEFLPIAVKRVNNTNTTATLMLACYGRNSA